MQSCAQNFDLKGELEQVAQDEAIIPWKSKAMVRLGAGSC